jgi:hypothetical protein
MLALGAASLVSDIARGVMLAMLALLAPGLAFTFALFPTGRLRLADRLVLAVGMSLATVLVVGAILGESSLRLNRTTLIVGLAATVAVAGLVAIARTLRQRSRPSESTRSVAPPVTSRRPRIGVIEVLVLSCAVGLVAVSVLAARVPLAAQGVTGHTLLWILPEADDSRKLQLGIESQEFSAVDFRLLIATETGAVLHESAIDLNPKETWQATMTIPTNVERVEARLFRPGTTSAYRSVYLVVDEGQIATPSLSHCLEIAVAQDSLIAQLGEDTAQFVPGAWLLLNDLEACKAER